MRNVSGDRDVVVDLRGSCSCSSCSRQLLSGEFLDTFEDELPGRSDPLPLRIRILRPGSVLNRTTDELLQKHLLDLVKNAAVSVEGSEIVCVGFVYANCVGH